jgi:DNA protecting protein DprA
MQCTQKELIIFLGLGRLRGVTYKSLRSLGSFDSVMKYYSQNGINNLIKTITHRTTQDSNVSESLLVELGEEVFNGLIQDDIHFVKEGDPEYPQSLSKLNNSVRPYWFFYKGNIELIHKPTIAIVGTRTPNEFGKFLTKYAISVIEQYLTSITSGLAKGIDETAHTWALNLNLPNIAVLGHGHFKLDKSRNGDLANLILEKHGLILSEYLPTATATAESFVWRNRIQAAISNGVIAPQWKKSSGTAHTIRFANQFGKPTINLDLNSNKTDIDLGVSDMSFDLPREHNEFTNLIQKISQNNFVYHQKSLLGD